MSAATTTTERTNMGRSTTPTFRVETFAPRCRMTPAAWPTKHLGRPSDATLREYVEGFEASTREGGCNAHLGATYLTRARIVRQSTGDVVATYEAPAFRVL